MKEAKEVVAEKQTEQPVEGSLFCHSHAHKIVHFVSKCLNKNEDWSSSHWKVVFVLRPDSNGSCCPPVEDTPHKFTDNLDWDSFRHCDSDFLLHLGSMEVDEEKRKINQKTLRDEHGQYPVWMNQRRMRKQKAKVKKLKAKGKKKTAW